MIKTKGKEMQESYTNSNKLSTNKALLLANSEVLDQTSWSDTLIIFFVCFFLHMY